MNDDYKLYLLTEMYFIKQRGNKKDLFPSDWYGIKDYHLKIDIINEALKYNIDIKETDKYLENKEGVKNDNF